MADEVPDGGFPLTGGRRELDEHKACLAAVGRLEACLDRPLDDASTWLGELRERLSELRAILAPHFAEEAEGYLYTEVPARAPGHAAKLDRLRAEHDTILRELDGVSAAAARRGGLERHELREINARAQLLVARIRRHEAEENEIIMSSLWDDIGAAD